MVLYRRLVFFCFGQGVLSGKGRRCVELGRGERKREGERERERKSEGGVNLRGEKVKGWTSRMAIWMPFSARSKEICWPIPALPPVTTATSRGQS